MLNEEEGFCFKIGCGCVVVYHKAKDSWNIVCEGNRYYLVFSCSSIYVDLTILSCQQVSAYENVIQQRLHIYHT